MKIIKSCLCEQFNNCEHLYMLKFMHMYTYSRVFRKGYLQLEMSFFPLTDEEVYEVEDEDADALDTTGWEWRLYYWFVFHTSATHCNNIYKTKFLFPF